MAQMDMDNGHIRQIWTNTSQSQECTATTSYSSISNCSIKNSLQQLLYNNRPDAQACGHKNAQQAVPTVLGGLKQALNNKGQQQQRIFNPCLTMLDLARAFSQTRL